MKKIVAMIAALLIALVGMSVIAVAEDSLMDANPVSEEVIFVEVTAVIEEAPAAEEAAAQEIEDKDEEVLDEAPLAVVEAQDFMLKYVNWNNEEIFSRQMVESEMIEELPFLSPIREGYTFQHWYDVEDETQTAFVFGQGIDKNLELRPLFVQDVAAEVEVHDVVIENSDANVESPIKDDDTAVDMQAIGDTVDIEDADIDGLEIVIIADQELDAPEETEDEGTVLIDDEEDEDGMLILEDDDMDELTMEDEAVPLAGPPMVAIDRQVNVRSTLGENVNENETVTLMGELIGFDDCAVTVQWQVFDGADWQNIAGANGMEYSFAATSESVNSSYRLAVAING